MRKIKNGYYAIPSGSGGYLMMEGDIEEVSPFDHVVFSADTIQALKREADERGLLEEARDMLNGNKIFEGDMVIVALGECFTTGYVREKIK